MKKLILTITLTLAMSVSAWADYLGCFEPNEAVEIKTLYSNSTGVLTDPTSPACDILDPNDTTLTSCTSGPTKVGSLTGIYESSHTIPASPLEGVWIVKQKGTVDSVVRDAADYFMVVDVAGECPGRVGVKLPTIPTDWITASGIADDAGNEIADQTWDEELAAHTTADTPGKVINILTQDAATLSTDVALTSVIGQMLDDGTAWSYSAATDSQEAIRDNLGGSAPTAAQIADAVWDEDATTHQIQGTFGQAIGDPVDDTDTIFGLANTNLDTTVSSRASQTSVNTVDDFLDTEVADILADTADMQPKLGTPAGTDMSADIAAIQADTDDIQLRVPSTTAANNIESAYSGVGYMGEGIAVTIASVASALPRVITITETTIITVDNQFVGRELYCSTNKEGRKIIATDNNTADTITVDYGNFFTVDPINTCYIK